MAKLFFSQPPSAEQIKNSLSQELSSIDPESISSYLAMRKLHSQIDISLDSYFADYNLSSGRFILLLLLLENPNGLMPSDLAIRVGVTQATISGVINNLVKSNFVERQQHQQDGRAFVIKLTDHGQQLLSRLQPDFYSRISEFMNALSSEERKAFDVLSAKLLSKVSKIHEAKMPN